MTTGVWTALAPVPAEAPTPRLPPGYEATEARAPDGALLGYNVQWEELETGKRRSGTLAWAQNGSPDAREWKWMRLPVPGLPVPAPTPAPAPAHEPEPPPEREEAAPPADYGGAAPDEPATAGAPEPPFPFTLLGHDHGVYFYLGHDSQQVTALKASQHTAANLYTLAPASFWGRRWPTKRGFDADQAASDLITLQHQLGVYDPARQRGRGVWWDKTAGKAVVHLGDSLLMDGQRVGLYENASKYIYECAVSIPFTAKPLSNAEANKLIKICEYLSWERQINGRLAAGFIVCAILSGAIRWRPCIWIQGEFQSGKSTVFNHIIARALGDMAKRYVGGVTEAALRAILRVDAMPILIDDLDANTARGRENILAILDLMKVFSGEDGGVIAKASQNGGPPVITNLSCCYAFSSVLMSVDDSAIKSRIAVLKLVPRKFEPGQLEELQTSIDAALPAEFAPALFARCVSLLPIIRRNAETFAQCIGVHTKQRRSGDLYGHLFAGAYSLFSDRLITPEQAMEYVGERKEVVALIAETKQDIVENNEGERCLAHLMEQVITDTRDGRMMRASVYELLQASRRDADDYDAAKASISLLRRNGIIVNHDGDYSNFYIANDHAALRELFAKSAWPVGWAGVLKTIPDSAASATMNFGSRKSRATRIPRAIIGDTTVPAQQQQSFDDVPI